VECTRRKLAVIVAADIGGYSRLDAIDEAGTLQVIRWLRDELMSPLFEKYGGRIADTASVRVSEKRPLRVCVGPISQDANAMFRSDPDRRTALP